MTPTKNKPKTTALDANARRLLRAHQPPDRKHPRIVSLTRWLSAARLPQEAIDAALRKRWCELVLSGAA